MPILKVFVCVCERKRVLDMCPFQNATENEVNQKVNEFLIANYGMNTCTGMTQLSLCYLLMTPKKKTLTHTFFSLYKITQHFFFFFGMKENVHDLFVSFRVISSIIKSFDDDDGIIPTGNEKEEREKERNTLD